MHEREWMRKQKSKREREKERMRKIIVLGGWEARVENDRNNAYIAWENTAWNDN